MASAYIFCRPSEVRTLPMGKNSIWFALYGSRMRCVVMRSPSPVCTPASRLNALPWVITACATNKRKAGILALNSEPEGP